MISDAHSEIKAAVKAILPVLGGSGVESTSLVTSLSALAVRTRSRSTR